MSTDFERWSFNWLTDKVERLLLSILTGALLIVVMLATVDLLVTLAKDIVDPPQMFRIDVSEMITVIGSFLLILIGLELIETLRAYQIDRKIRVEVVLGVALTAMARKIMLLVGKDPDAEHPVRIRRRDRCVGDHLLLHYPRSRLDRLNKTARVEECPGA